MYYENTHPHVAGVDANFLNKNKHSNSSTHIIQSEFNPLGLLAVFRCKGSPAGTKIQVESQGHKYHGCDVHSPKIICYLCSKHGKNSGQLCETREKDYIEIEHVNLDHQVNILPRRVFFSLLFEQPSYFIVTGRLDRWYRVVKTQTFLLWK